MACILCKLLIHTYHWLWSFGAAFWYRFPSRQLTVIGITGTKGKSTVVEMTHAIFAEAGSQSENVELRDGVVSQSDTTGINNAPGSHIPTVFLNEPAGEKYKGYDDVLKQRPSIPYNNFLIEPKARNKGDTTEPFISTVASASSVRFRIGDKEEANMLKMTMPGKGVLQKFLRAAADAKCQYAVLEVTSEGIRQFRHAFIDFDAAVFTNLSPEHIESHGSFEKYRAEKLKLFRAPQFHAPDSKRKNIAIVNLDDENVDYFLNNEAGITYGYRIKNENEKLKTINKNVKLVEAQDVRISESGIEFNVVAHDTETDGYKFKVISYKLSTLGAFNVYNALAAICVGLAYGVPLEVSARALEKFRGVPGRMEVIARKPFRVIVDYAHTPDALEKVYRTLRSKEQGRLVCVLGAAGGGRDKWKRPEFGRIAAQYCDEVFLTDEDPYEEDPCQILSQIKSGIPNSKFPTSKLYEVLDRREAIRKAIKSARPGDTVVITGKGCEPWMMVKNGEKIPWDDRQIARAAIDEK